MTGDGEIERLREEVVHDGPFFTVFDDEVRWPSGRTGRHLRVRPPRDEPGAVVIPRCGELVGLVETYRYPIGARQRGFPRGSAHGADPEATARAELWEELGLTPRTLTPLGRLTPDSGLQSTRAWVFLAEVDRRSGTTRDPDEVLGVEWLSVAELLGLVGTPPYDDGLTLAALALLLARDR